MMDRITSRDRRALKNIFNADLNIELVRPFAVSVTFDQTADIAPIIEAGTHRERFDKGDLTTNKRDLYKFANDNGVVLILNNATFESSFTAKLKIVDLKDKAPEDPQFQLIQDPPHRDQYTTKGKGFTLEDPDSIVLTKEFEDQRNIPTTYTTALHTRHAMQKMLLAERDTLHPLVMDEMERQLDKSFTFSLVSGEIESRNVILEHDESFTNRLRSYYEDAQCYDHHWQADAYQTVITPNSWWRGDQSLLHFRQGSNEPSTLRSTYLNLA